MTDYRTDRNRDNVTHVDEALASPLTVVNLKREAAAVEPYRNFVLLNINNHCIRMSVMEGEYRWHRHPHSDESFLVLEGQLEVDVRGGQCFRLEPGEALTIPKGVSHRTRSRERSVNLCFEARDAYTDVVFEDQTL